MTMIDRDELLKHEVMIITKGNAAFHGVPSSLIETAPVIDLKNLQPVGGDWAENRENMMLDDVTHWMPNIAGPELEEHEA